MAEPLISANHSAPPRGSSVGAEDLMAGGHHEVTGMEIEKRLFVRSDPPQVFRVGEAAGKCLRVIEPEFGDAVILDRRQARQGRVDGVLLDVAADRLPHGRDRHEEVGVDVTVMVNELLAS